MKFGAFLEVSHPWAMTQR